MTDDKKIPVVLDFHKRDMLLGVGTHKEASPGDLVSLDILVSETNEVMDDDKLKNREKSFNPDLKLIFTHPSQISIIIKGLEEAKKLMEEARKDSDGENLLKKLLNIVKEVSAESGKKYTKDNTIH